MRPRKLPTFVRALPRLQICGNCLEQVSKTNGKMRKQKELLTAPPRHIGLAMIPSLLLQAGFMRRLDSACQLGRDQTTGETNECIEEVTSNDILDQSARFLCEDVPVQDELPTPAQHDDVAVSEFEQCLRVEDIHGPEKLVNHDLNDIRNARLFALRLSVTSWPPLAVRGLCSHPPLLVFVSTVSSLLRN